MSSFNVSALVIFINCFSSVLAGPRIEVTSLPRKPWTTKSQRVSCFNRGLFVSKYIFLILAIFLFSFALYPHWILLEKGLFFSILLHVETTWRINLFSWIFYSSFFCLPSLFLLFNVFNRCSSIILTTFFGYKNQDKRHFIRVKRKAYGVTMNVTICVKGKKHEHNRLY